MSAWKSALVCAVFFGFVAQAARSVADEQAEAKMREELPTAICEAVRLLEAEQYEKFLDAYITPDQRTHLVKRKIDLASAAKEFRGAQANGLLQALKSLKHRTPKYEKEGTTAIYSVRSSRGWPPDWLTFVKSGKYWYIDFEN